MKTSGASLISAEAPVVVTWEPRLISVPSLRVVVLPEDLSSTREWSGSSLVEENMMGWR